MTSAVVPLTKRFTDAVDVARQVHDGKTIKGTDLPYLLHVLDVCSIALRHGADETVAIAALLHDVVEDGGGTPMAKKIRSQFGSEVIDIVLACSDSKVEDPADKLPWWQRKVAYIDHLTDATPGIALVSAADKLSNVRSILADLDVQGERLWDRFNTGRMGTLWYYHSVARILPGRLADNDGGKRIGRALADAVAQLEDAVGAAIVAADLLLADAEVDKTRAASDTAQNSD